MIDELEWPIDMKYSCIKKFSIEAPVFSLDKKASKLTMEDVLIVVSAKSGDWVFQEEKEVQKLKKHIEQFISHLREELIQVILDLLPQNL